MDQRFSNSQKTISYAETNHNPTFSRIMCAAVINKSFRKLLLSNPELAVTSGYCGETFHLREDEKRFLTSIHADNLKDFAAQLFNKPEPASVTLSFASLE
jgi:hypothetical protein